MQRRCLWLFDCLNAGGWHFAPAKKGGIQPEPLRTRSVALLHVDFFSKVPDW
jgi:hypothetical protein